MMGRKCFDTGIFFKSLQRRSLRGKPLQESPPEIRPSLDPRKKACQKSWNESRLSGN